MSDEIKSLIEKQGQAFEAFRTTHDELKKSDAVTAEKLERIEKSLDEAIEAKAKIEARLDAERKEREGLELRLARKGGEAGGEKIVEEVKSHGIVVGKAGAYSADDYASYKAAQDLYLRKGEKNLTAEQFKAMSVGGDPDGGYFVTPDVSGRMVMKVYETSPIRQIANVQTISTDKIEGVEDLGEAGAGWVTETGSRTTTDTPQVGKWSIEAYEMYAAPKATQKLLDDASVNIEAWLGAKVGERFGRLEATAFVVGDGMGKPRGFTKYTTAEDTGSVSWGQIGYIKSGASADFASSNPVDKLFDMVGALKNEYLGNARWVTRRSVITKMRKFKDTTGQYLWQPSLQVGQPESFLGYPITRAEDMPTLAASSLSLAFGDFNQAYQIVDRVGIRTLRDPYTDKPYVIFYSTRRVGGGVVNFEAIKLMHFNS